MDENNFTSHVCWALQVEEITPHAKQMACEKEMACCVRGYHVYKDIWAAAIGEVLVCSRKPTNVENFVVKLYSRKIFLYIVFVRKYFYNKIKANYGMQARLIECLEKKQFTIFPIRKECQQGSKIKSSATVPVYCINCHMPEIKQASMIQSSHCKRWYHGRHCVKTPKNA